MRPQRVQTQRKSGRDADARRSASARGGSADGVERRVVGSRGSPGACSEALAGSIVVSRCRLRHTLDQGRGFALPSAAGSLWQPRTRRDPKPPRRPLDLARLAFLPRPHGLAKSAHAPQTPSDGGAVVKMSADLLLKTPIALNAVKDRELSLRGAFARCPRRSCRASFGAVGSVLSRQLTRPDMQIPAIENLGVTKVRRHDARSRRSTRCRVGSDRVARPLKQRDSLAVEPSAPRAVETSAPRRQPCQLDNASARGPAADAHLAHAHRLQGASASKPVHRCDQSIRSASLRDA